MYFSTLFFSCGLAPLALAAYSVQDDYSGNNFFAMFSFDTENDPTSGYVNYVDGATAQADNLTSVDNGVITIRSDSTNVASGRGRNSVRLTSYKQYTHGLMVLDLAHMPGSACGIWPAFWMIGPSWPNNGEIDIIEGVNYQTQNAITMHSGPGCTMINKDCEGDTGCSVQTGGSNSYADGFNNGGGGVYAMEWTSDAINVWFFGRDSVPAGTSGDSPDPTTWGTATASFQGGAGCTIDDHFQNNNIVLDTTFCGSWAGQVWSTDATCSSKAATCQDYVQNNPSAFESAYWTINSLKVYSESSSSAAAVAAAPVPSSTPPAAPVAQPTTTPATPAPQPTTTPVAAPSPSPSPWPSPSAPNSSGPVAVGSAASGGSLSEHPATDNNGLVLGANGQIEENPDKRELKAGMNMSIVEGVNGELHVNKEKVERHFRRHQMGHAVGRRS